MNLSKIIERDSSCYDKYLCIGFKLKTSETALRNFCDLYKLTNLVRELTYFKNPYNPLFINLLLKNCSRNFQDTRQLIKTGLSNFHKMNLTVLKMYFNKKNMKPFSTGVIKNLMT